MIHPYTIFQFTNKFIHIVENPNKIIITIQMNHIQNKKLYSVNICPNINSNYVNAKKTKLIHTTHIYI